MVVLEHDAIEKPYAMVPPSAASNAILFEVSVSWSGFSRIQKPGAGVAQPICKSASGGGYAAKSLEEIQECSLYRQNGLAGPRYCGYRFAWGNPFSIFSAFLELQTFIKAIENFIR